MIAFAFLLIFQLIFRFHVKFQQGIQGYQNILNNKFETIYQVPRQKFGLVMNMMLFSIFLALPCAT